MAVRSRVVSVATTATALNDLPEYTADNQFGSAATVYNDGTVTVFLGGADVTTSGATKGVPLAPTASLDVQGQNDVLHGIVATGTCAVIVLEAGVDAA